MPVRTTSDDIILFDRKTVRRHRDRAAATFADHDFLHREIADQLADRLHDVKRDFATALDLGGGHGTTTFDPAPETMVTADLSDRLLNRMPGGLHVSADEEFLPFAENAFDLIASTLSLHWVNDLPGALVQIRRALKPDGLFLAAMLGGDTLIELRRAFLEAEAETTGGTSPHTSPVADVADAGALLQRAGFALPVIDTDTITVTYSDMFALMRELRGMGEANAVAARSRAGLRRDTLFAAAARYQELYADDDGRIPATFQIIWMTGWAPHETQQQPLAARQRDDSAGRRAGRRKSRQPATRHRQKDNQAAAGMRALRAVAGSPSPGSQRPRPLRRDPADTHHTHSYRAVRSNIQPPLTTPIAAPSEWPPNSRPRVSPMMRTPICVTTILAITGKVAEIQNAEDSGEDEHHADIGRR